MIFTRNLKRGMQGGDVRYMKDALVQLGYLKKSTHGTFGTDTFTAVKAYQRASRDTAGKKLVVDGVIGRLTWDAVVRDLGRAQGGETPADTGDIPNNIGKGAAQQIARDLGGVSETRKKIVLLALRYAYDPEVPQKYPYSLYIRGGNLFNQDLTENVITAARIESGAARQPEYYAGGSKEMMLAAVRADKRTTGADCSGGIVGLLRKLGLVEAGFDRTANGLCSASYSAAVEKSALRPGDFVGRSGHIGLYVGGGYAVEWVGQLYGCQLTKLDARRAYDFVGKRFRARSGWTKFRDPKFY